jgi:hypothetical protein
VTPHHLDTGKRAFARWTRALALIALGVGSSAITTLSQAQATADDGWSALRDGALAWRNSTHQVNITALTGIVPASGEGVVLRAQGGELQVLGRVRP